MAVTRPAAHQLGTGTLPVSRLISVTGTVDPATPRDVEQRLAAGGFFWLDLECLDGERLEQFARSLRLDASVAAGPEGAGQSGLAVASTGAPQRPSVAAVGDSVQALVPGAGGPGSGRSRYPGSHRVHREVPSHRAFGAVPGTGAGASPV